MSCSEDIVKNLKRLKLRLQLLPIIAIFLFIVTSIIGAHYGFDSSVITLSALLVGVELFIVYEVKQEMQDYIKAVNRELKDEV